MHSERGESLEVGLDARAAARIRACDRQRDRKLHAGPGAARPVDGGRDRDADQAAEVGAVQRSRSGRR